MVEVRVPCQACTSKATPRECEAQNAFTELEKLTGKGNLLEQSIFLEGGENGREERVSSDIHTG
jgi:hypothetical protein